MTVVFERGRGRVCMTSVIVYVMDICMYSTTAHGVRQTIYMRACTSACVHVCIPSRPCVYLSSV